MPNSSSNPKPSSLVVGPLQGRTPSPLNAVGEDLLVKAAGADTMQQFAFFHLTVPNMSGPPLHVHTREDELFYVLDGELVFEIADQRVAARAGTMVFAPRGTVHTYQNFTKQAAHLLIMVTPAGLERFFEELSAGTAHGSMPDLGFLQSLHGRFGLTTMGPPLS